MSTDLKPSTADKAFDVMKALASVYPATGFLASLVDDFIPSEVSKRRDALLLKLEKDFEEISEKIDNDMLTKPHFISVFMQSFRSAMATEKEEKIDAFRAIILNSLLVQNSEGDGIDMMVRITDSLTILHIKLLKVFINPSAFLENNPDAKARFGNLSMGSISNLTTACFPHYPPDIVKVALNDLEGMGLGSGMAGAGTMTMGGILQGRLTDFGKRYLDFITLPTAIS